MDFAGVCACVCVCVCLVRHRRMLTACMLKCGMFAECSMVVLRTERQRVARAVRVEKLLSRF